MDTTWMIWSRERFVEPKHHPCGNINISKERLSVLLQSYYLTYLIWEHSVIKDCNMYIRSPNSRHQRLRWSRRCSGYIITPNRLRLGRNNERIPAGRFDVTNKSSTIIQQNLYIFNTWFVVWLASHVRIVVEKWSKSGRKVVEKIQKFKHALKFWYQIFTLRLG